MVVAVDPDLRAARVGEHVQASHAREQRVLPRGEHARIVRQLRPEAVDARADRLARAPHVRRDARAPRVRVRRGDRLRSEGRVGGVRGERGVQAARERTQATQLGDHLRRAGARRAEPPQVLAEPGPPIAVVRDIALEDGEGRGGPRGRDVLDRAGDLGHVREADARRQKGADLVVEAPPRLDPPERLEDEAVTVDHRRVGLLDAEAPGRERGRLGEGGGAVARDEAEVAARARHPRPPPERLE